MHHQYGIYVVIAQTSFQRESGGEVKCRLFTQAKLYM